MTELHVLNTPREDAISSAKEVLTESIELEFETVLICGFKNGEVKMKMSRMNDVTKILGAIEALKFELLREWK